jgi:hypothetical protein
MTNTFPIERFSSTGHIEPSDQNVTPHLCERALSDADLGDLKHLHLVLFFIFDHWRSQLVVLA